MSVESAVQATVRAATPSDAAALAWLRYEFRAALGEAVESEDAFIERCARWMHDRLREDDRWRAWVAGRDGHILGTVWAHLIEKVPNPVPERERHAYVTNLYVRPDARGRGVGSELLSAALRWCETQQVHAVILWPSERSRSLYTRHGFAVRDDLMELVIGGGE